MIKSILKINYVLLVALGACTTYEWAPTAPDGTTISSARSQCRAQAREMMREIRPTGAYDTGPAGFPPDSPRDMENRETERCIASKGFEKIRVE